MSAYDTQGDSVTRGMRLAAKIIGIAWASWWTYYSWGTGIAEQLPGLQLVLRALWPSALFFVVAALAWVSDLGGGIAAVVTGLVLVALLFGDLLGTDSLAAVLLTLAQPPLTSGTLLLLCWSRMQNARR